uniref:Inositol polyphosphate-related phosphatase domain-containing protein n=1 Tax=Grammatophora oceanica TaxID=210454 RepID=A0A7S1UV41_9STRA
MRGSTSTKKKENRKRSVFVPALDDEADSKVLQQLILERLPSYKFVVRFQRGEMRLEILVRKQCNVTVETLKVKARNTGLGVDGILNAANKGGIMAELLVGGTTRMSFCTAHLQAHEGKEHYKTRCKSVETILEGTADETTLGKGSSHNVRMDMASKSHVCFFLGDLNYRTDLLRGGGGTTPVALSQHGSTTTSSHSTTSQQQQQQPSLTPPQSIHSTSSMPAPYDRRVQKSRSKRLVSTIKKGVKKSPAAINNVIHSSIASLSDQSVGGGSFSNQSRSEEALSKEEHNDMVRSLVESEDWFELNKADELFAAIHRRDAFCGFETLPCFFPPTFKVERGAGFQYKDQRRPSYTDRILWKTVHHLEEAVQPMVYEPIVDFVTSDHKPIRGAFRVELNHHIMIRPQLAKRPSIFDGMGMSMRNMFSTRAPSSLRSGGRARDQQQHQRLINKTLHLRISNIECNIRPKAGPMDLFPDPYVSFISIPRQLVKAKVRSWSKVKGFFRLGANLQLDARTDSHGKVQRTVHGFPRTKKLSRTYNPKWLDPKDDVHLVVKQVDGKTGKPMNLGGSLLMICVFDHLPSLDDNMVGCFPVNLAHLYEQTSLQQQQGFVGGIGTSNTALHPPSSASSTMSFRRDAYQNNGTGEHMTVRRCLPTPLEEPCHSMLLKQPILKNGKQTGWIACTIDCYWMKPDDRISVGENRPLSESLLNDASSVST